MNLWLLDTGPLVAYLDSSDPAHEHAARIIDSFNGQLCTTSAVVTEAMHFVANDSRGPELLVEFLEASRTYIAEYCQPGDLKRATRLMKKYADTPMDFADATLILLADALNQNTVCTLDRRGFSTYRTASGKRFILIMNATISE